MIKYAMYNATRTTASFFLSFPSLNIQNIKKAVTILKGKSYTIETLGTVYVEISPSEIVIAAAVSVDAS